jgi:hypothetical protein
MQTPRIQKHWKKKRGKFFCYRLMRGRRRGRPMPDMTARGADGILCLLCLIVLNYRCLMINHAVYVTLFYNTRAGQGTLNRLPRAGIRFPIPDIANRHLHRPNGVRIKKHRKKMDFFCYRLMRGRRRGRAMPNIRARGELTRLMGQGQLGHKKKGENHAWHESPGW